MVGTLECDGKPQPVGDAVGEGSPGISADDDAETALKVWIGDVARFYVALPLGGFDVERRSEHFVLFAHRSEGEAKVLVLAADIGDVLVPGSWTVTRFAACDASEFARDVRMGYDVRIWTDNEGRVPTARLLEREDCYGGRALRVDGQLFVRDPTGDAFDRKALLSTYHGNVALPKSARLTAYRDGDRLLHLAADGSAAFVESPARVERWPRVRGDEYVRTDCN